MSAVLPHHRAARSLRGKPLGKQTKHSLLLITYCCELRVMTEGDSDDCINILIKLLLSSGFWQLDSQKTQFREFLVSESN